MRPSDLAALAPFETLLAVPGSKVALPPLFAAVLPSLTLPAQRSGGGPPLLVNFVTTLDGAVRLSAVEPDSKAVALGSAHDWLLLGLLRSLATTIVVGAAPLRYGRSRQDGAAALPGLAAELADLRSSVGLGPLHHVVVCGSGDLPIANPVWHQPATVVTTPGGAAELARRGLPTNVEVVIDAAGSGHRVAASTVARTARERATASTPRERAVGPVPRFVLAEPGPSLFAELVGAGEVDELFLTLSPLLAGPAEGRLGLVGGPLHAELRLVGLQRAGSHLFSRWQPVTDPATN